MTNDRPVVVLPTTQRRNLFPQILLVLAENELVFELITRRDVVFEVVDDLVEEVLRIDQFGRGSDLSGPGGRGKLGFSQGEKFAPQERRSSPEQTGQRSVTVHIVKEVVFVLVVVVERLGVLGLFLDDIRLLLAFSERPSALGAVSEEVDEEEAAAAQQKTDAGEVVARVVGVDAVQVS